MSALSQRIREYRKTHECHFPMVAFNVLRDPVEGEDDVARFARIAGVLALGWRLNNEDDWKFYRRIRQLALREHVETEVFNRRIH